MGKQTSKLMNSFGDKLNCRVDVYGGTQTENDLGELDYDYALIKSVWANIIPQGGNLEKWNGNTVFVEVSHKFIIRAGAVRELKCDMYFMYKGQRYDVKYINPNYALMDRIEVYCMLRVE